MWRGNYNYNDWVSVGMCLYNINKMTKVNIYFGYGTNDNGEGVYIDHYNGEHDMINYILQHIFSECCENDCFADSEMYCPDPNYDGYKCQYYLDKYNQIKEDLSKTGIIHSEHYGQCDSNNGYGWTYEKRRVEIDEKDIY